MQALASTLLIALTLAGCAQIDAKTRGWMGSNAPAYAVVDGVVFEGRATLFTDRTGTLQLASTQAADRLCVGDLRYSSTTQGEIVLHCAGGVDARLRFVAVSPVSGYAYGSSETSPASMTWGLDPTQAAAYLRLPPSPPPVEPAALAMPPAVPASAAP
ncbi:hypothetical protein SAMN05216303_107144 [Rhodoferax sp. OV413]|uniref:hypothetical protein n=1 Tax=Rhodoferax sp. OV413 TaxID=1855285 RepID=UPI000887874B|nr:hypothetical protein [Rhodoferax sp. OV413]SDP80454.1 hypothetical protein SAMN05216303_107144 [Rhodoferax sp. OV413]